MSVPLHFVDGYGEVPLNDHRLDALGYLLSAPHSRRAVTSSALWFDEQSGQLVHHFEPLLSRRARRLARRLSRSPSPRGRSP